MKQVTLGNNIVVGRGIQPRLTLNSHPTHKHIHTQIVAKALDGQRYPLSLCECMFVLGG